MSRNTGATSLRKKRREGDPMTAYDGLPPLLRRWLSQAILPWSPVSAQRIWVKSIAKGLTPEEILISLNDAETRTLAQDRHSVTFKYASES